MFTTKYSLRNCEVGVVHIGYGAFHRSHQAVYIDDLMELTGDTQWGIAAVNLRASESRAFAESSKLNEGYLLKTIAPNGDLNFRTVRSHKSFVDAVLEPDTAYKLLALPNVTVVTITVTESGYYFKNDWSLDINNPVIGAGLANRQSETIYDFLEKSLAHRASTLDEPITILCCDNIRNNGLVLQNALIAYLEFKNLTNVANWVRKNVTFPCSMVDRITPRSTPELKNEIYQVFPKYAGHPVHAETFLQWVIEDNFASGMPDLKRVGVQIVANVEPYEEAKIRILNGGHTGLAYLGALAGYVTFDQAISDSKLRDYFDKWELNEVLPGLDKNIPFDTKNYLQNIILRFGNAGISDQLERICMDGYSKMSIYIRPTLEACLEKGIFPEAGFDCVASWIIYARRYQSGHCKVVYHEPFWEKLEPMLVKGKELEIASDEYLWGDLPRRFENFCQSLIDAIERMDQRWRV